MDECSYLEAEAELKKKYPKMGFVCQLCHERGHIALQCHKNKKCQLCYKFGHIALQRHKLVRCQLCSGVNHTAATCHSRPT